MESPLKKIKLEVEKGRNNKLRVQKESDIKLIRVQKETDIKLVSEINIELSRMNIRRNTLWNIYDLQ